MLPAHATGRVLTASIMLVLQIITVKITATDVEFSSEDEGKVSQSSVHFPASYFSDYNFSGQPSSFSVQLGALVDALRVFAAMPEVEVHIAETPAHLELEVSDVGDDTALHMYAHIALLAPSKISHLIDHWQAPATEFSTTAATLREAVEDLEWPQSHVRITVKANPFQVSRSCFLSTVLLSTVLQLLQGH
jgi:Repair protein Rad1/Rec1/Rad17